MCFIVYFTYPHKGHLKFQSVSQEKTDATTGSLENLNNMFGKNLLILLSPGVAR